MIPRRKPIARSTKPIARTKRIKAGNAYTHPEVRRMVLTPRERAWINVGEKYEAKRLALLVYADPKVGKQGPECDAFVKAGDEFDAALAEARALTPEVGNG